MTKEKNKMISKGVKEEEETKFLLRLA